MFSKNIPGVHINIMYLNLWCKKHKKFIYTIDKMKVKENIQIFWLERYHNIQSSLKWWPENISILDEETGIL